MERMGCLDWYTLNIFICSGCRGDPPILLVCSHRSPYSRRVHEERHYSGCLIYSYISKYRNMCCALLSSITFQKIHLKSSPLA